MPIEKDMSKCNCSKSGEVDPEKHEDTCPYKMMYAALTCVIEYGEDELLCLLYLLQSYQEMDRSKFAAHNGEGLMLKTLEAVKVMASLKSVGKMPEGE